ncbi:MAG: transcription antitermination protein NusB [Gammaproteobacteria bacterium]
MAFKLKMRRLARQRVVCSLYAQMHQGQLDAWLPDPAALPMADADWQQELVQGVCEHINELDADLAALSVRSLEQVDDLEKCILRLVCYEARFCPEVPWKVVITEAVRLAQDYCSPESYRFINGMAEQLTHKYRAD